MGKKREPGRGWEAGDPDLQKWLRLKPPQLQNPGAAPEGASYLWQGSKWFKTRGDRVCGLLYIPPNAVVTRPLRP